MFSTTCCEYAWLPAHVRLQYSSPTAVTSELTCNGKSIPTSVIGTACACKQVAYDAKQVCLEVTNETFVGSTTLIGSGHCTPTGCPPGFRTYHTMPTATLSCFFEYGGKASNLAQMYETSCQGSQCSIHHVAT